MNTESGTEVPAAAGPVVELSEADYEDYEQLKKDWREIVAGMKQPERGFLSGTQIGGSDGGPAILFRDRLKYEQMLQRPSLSENADVQTRLEMVKAIIGARYQRDFRLNAKYLTEGEGTPQVKRGPRIEGIAMDIEDSD